MIYWDHNSTTPCAPEVVSAMQPFWSEAFGNPGSSHMSGRRAAGAVTAARAQVASLLHCRAGEVIFTSGATESNNIVFLSLLLSEKSDKRRVVTTSIEHKSVLEPANLLAKNGFEVVYLPVTHDGVVDLKIARTLISSETVLVSVQAANNEIGTLQPVEELANIAHAAGAFFHTDAAQALGKIPVDLDSWGCDFASFSSHKLYGPKGIGALFVRGGPRRWPWPYPLLGGGQEGGLRPGTSNVPAIVGFGEACRLASNYISDMPRLQKLTDLFVENFKINFPECIIHAQSALKLPGTISIAFPGIPSDILMANCPDYCFSLGSACSAGAVGPSHVLQQIVSDPRILESTVRISLGKDSELKELDGFTKILKLLAYSNIM